MSISVCYECGEKISTSEKICSHCGCAIQSNVYNEENEYKINGVIYDLSPFMDGIDCEDDLWHEKKWDIIKRARVLTNCADIGALFLKIHRKETNSTEEFIGPTEEEMLEQAAEYNATRPKCPTCSSTNIRSIGFGERTLSVSLLGFASKKFNKTFECNNCGYTW